MDEDEREEYERRLRAKHPEPVWWENLGRQRWLVFFLGVAVVAMIVVGYVVN